MQYVRVCLDLGDAQHSVRHLCAGMFANSGGWGGKREENYKCTMVACLMLFFLCLVPFGEQALWGVQEPRAGVGKQSEITRLLRPKLLQHSHHVETPAEVGMPPSEVLEC